jgi:surface-anchored protein
MPRAVLFVIVWALTLTGAAAEDVSVLVSSVAGARAHDPAVGVGYVVLPAPHADLNVNWNATTQTFSGGFRTDSDSIGGGAFVQFGPEDAIAYLPATGQRPRTSSAPQYDFQGAVGDTYWVFPSATKASNDAFTLYLGFTASGVARDGTFTDDRIRWTVYSVENLTTPSATSFYGYTVSAGPTVNMQLTLDPAYPNSEMAMLGLSHTHLNLLFKAPGMYRITFRVRGTLVATGQEVSSLVPVHFGVEQWQIPASTVSYAAWRDIEFNPEQAADPLVSDPAADPDNDGFTNLQEFAFGGDPLVPDASLLTPRLQRSGNSWIFTVRQRTNGSGLTISPQAAANLYGGEWRPDLLTIDNPPRNVAPGIDEFAYLLNGGLTERAFLRVHTQLTAP